MGNRVEGQETALEVQGVLGYMEAALEEAKAAYAAGETPVGAVIVKDGVILARAHNQVEGDKDPSAHAELLAIRRAAQALKTWRLNDCVLYTTLEPCPMCAGAILSARIRNVFFGARDTRAGCTGSVYDFSSDPGLPGGFSVAGGLYAEACAALLEAFFSMRRQGEADQEEV